METGMCGNSRRTGGANVYGERISRVKNGIKSVVTFLLAATLFAASGGSASAALPAPNWMPGAPVMAGSQVILLWTPVPGAVKYFIYLNGKKIQESVSIQLMTSTPEEAGTFEYLISAVDASGAEGAKSSPGVVKVFKLAPPRDLSGRLIGEKVGLNWGSVSGAVLYNVYRSNESGKGFAMVDSIQDVRWTDGKASKGKKYFYRVTAKDASGKESGPSAEIVVSTEVAQAAAADERIGNVIGLRTRKLFDFKDKDFTSKGIINIAEPVDIDHSPDAKLLYISSANTGTIIVLDANGEFVNEFGNGKGELTRPYGLAVTPDGRVYVADNARDEVLVFSADGKFEKVAAKLTKHEWMKEPPYLSDVVVDERGNVHVLDGRNAAVLVFNPNGEEISHIHKKDPKLDPKEQTGAVNMFKLEGGKYYLADFTRGVLVVTDTKGKILSRIGKQGSGVGLLTRLSGFDVDVAGKKAYLADVQTYLVQVYDMEKNRYLYTLANKDNKGQMEITAPKALLVLPAAKRIYVNQGMLNQVSGFEMFGEPEEAGK